MLLRKCREEILRLVKDVGVGAGIQHIAFYIGMVIFMSPSRGIEMVGRNGP